MERQVGSGIIDILKKIAEISFKTERFLRDKGLMKPKPVDYEARNPIRRYQGYGKNYRKVSERLRGGVLDRDL